MPMKLRNFCTIREAADRLGLGYVHTYVLAESGQLPYTLFGENVRAIQRSDVAALEASHASRDVQRNKERPVKKNNRGDLMQLGEYYTLEQAAEQLAISKYTVIDALKAGLIEKELFGGAIAIHESQVERLPQIWAEYRGEEKRQARQELLAAGFVYHPNPPPGTSRGSSGNQSPSRRGWYQDGVYYGLTAVKALREWQRRLK